MVVNDGYPQWVDANDDCSWWFKRMTASDDQTITMALDGGDGCTSCREMVSENG